jgi:acetyltransferase EpsM
MIIRPINRLCLLGGGEHARVVADAATADSSWELAGYFSPTPASLEFPHLGTDMELLATIDGWRESWFHLAFLGTPGGNVRRACLEYFSNTPLHWAIIKHPTAIISPSAIIGEGTYIGARSVVQPGARIGPHCVINTGTIVEHDAVLGVGVHLAPGSLTGGGTEIGNWSTVGLNASIRDHIRIGSDATVGMGAVVVKPVRDNQVVVGNPARTFLRSAR